MALPGSEGSERFALSGAQSSCQADRFFVTAGAFTLPLNSSLCKYFFASRRRRKKGATHAVLMHELPPQKRESDDSV
jgi:hypothetical protein